MQLITEEEMFGGTGLDQKYLKIKTGNKETGELVERSFKYPCGIDDG